MENIYLSVEQTTLEKDIHLSWDGWYENLQSHECLIPFKISQEKLQIIALCQCCNQTIIGHLPLIWKTVPEPFEWFLKSEEARKSLAQKVFDEKSARVSNQSDTIIVAQTTLTIHKRTPQTISL